MKQLLIALVAVVGINGPAWGADAQQPTQEAASTYDFSDFAKMWEQFVPTVQGSAPAATTLQLNHPGAYAQFMNPATYAQFMNPATYAQFMSPAFYLQFADVNKMMQFMNPAAYGLHEPGQLHADDESRRLHGLHEPGPVHAVHEPGRLQGLHRSEPLLTVAEPGQLQGAGRQLISSTSAAPGKGQGPLGPCPFSLPACSPPLAEAGAKE